MKIVQPFFILNKVTDIVVDFSGVVEYVILVHCFEKQCVASCDVNLQV